MAEPRDISLGSVLGYAEIAKLMNVEVPTVRIYAGRDPDFPEAVTPPSWRSPGFSKQDVETYIKKRVTRGIGKPGRPPGQEEVRLQLGPEVGVRVREILAEKRHGASVSTMKNIAELLELSTASVGFRMSGKARWRRSELEALAGALGASVDELTGAASE